MKKILQPLYDESGVGGGWVFLELKVMTDKETHKEDDEVLSFGSLSSQYRLVEIPAAIADSPDFYSLRFFREHTNHQHTY